MSTSQPPEIPVSPPPMPPVQFGGPAAQLAPRKPNWPKVVGIIGGIADVILFIVVATGSKEMFVAQPARRI